MKIEDFKFDEKGLICAIAQDTYTGEVLMQAYMNKQSILATCECGYATYFSRSRQKLWKKGETSGNLQRVIEMKYDCDSDCILLKVEQIGGIACHTGAKSCFFNTLYENDYVPDYKIIFEVAQTIKVRKVDPQKGSYTNYLFDKGIDKICKKIGEEATEAVIAAISGKKEELIGEICDLVYHGLVLMEAKDIKLSDIYGELLKRDGRIPNPKYIKLDDDKERNRDK